MQRQSRVPREYFTAWYGQVWLGHYAWLYCMCRTNQCSAAYNIVSETALSLVISCTDPPCPSSTCSPHPLQAQKIIDHKAKKDRRDREREVEEKKRRAWVLATHHLCSDSDSCTVILRVSSPVYKLHTTFHIGSPIETVEAHTLNIRTVLIIEYIVQMGQKNLKRACLCHTRGRMNISLHSVYIFVCQ